MRAIRLLLVVIALAAGLDPAFPGASLAGAAQPVTVDCPAGLVIDKPGSYVLTTGTVNCAAPTAISISASKVLLDLDGRTLDGADQNGTIGILVEGEKVVVRNGGVQDFELGILSLGSKVVIDGVTAVSNRNDGFQIRDGTLVSNSRSEFNSGDGLDGGNGNTLRGNVFNLNGSHGVFLDDGNTLVGNTANGNGFAGFMLNDDNKVLRNTVAFNGTQGMEGFERNIVKGNTAASNGGDGLYMNARAIDGGRSRFTGNVAIGNGGTGVVAEGTCVVEKNRISGNQGNGVYGLRGVFKGNEVTGNVSAGLSVADSVVVKNTLIGNRWGIFTGDNVESIVLTGNVATANSEDGIFVFELLNPAAAQIQKNVVHGNGQQGIELPTGVVPVGVGKNTAHGNGQRPECDADLCRE